MPDERPPLAGGYTPLRASDPDPHLDALLGQALAATIAKMAPDTPVAAIEQVLLDISTAGLSILAERQLVGQLHQATKLGLSDLRQQLEAFRAPEPAAQGGLRAPGWRDALVRNLRGAILGTADNVLRALRTAPEWQGVLAQSHLDQRAWLRTAPPWHLERGWAPRPMADADEASVLIWCQQQGIPATPQMVRPALAVHLGEHMFHPIRDYLDSLKWDGTPRIHDWLRLALGAGMIPGYTDRVAAAWLISAVARVMKPGCQAKYCLILEGPQDLGKSTALSILGGQWYTDDVADLGTKDSQVQIAAAWIVELAELDSIRRNAWSATKGFLARKVDRFRPPYGRSVVEQPRQCVFAGTTNERSEYLSDDTGNVRFWPVRCGDAAADLLWLERNRDQLWAEAFVAYRAGEKWYIDDLHAVAAASEQQEARSDYDDWEARIAQWLDGTMRDEVTVSEVIAECLEIKDAAQQTRSLQIRVGRLLAQRLGWHKRRETHRRWYVRPPS